MFDWPSSKVCGRGGGLRQRPLLEEIGHRPRGPVDPSFLRETLRVGRTMPRIRKRSPKFRLDKQCAYEHEERADKRISSIAFNVCDILVRQRTLAINPLRDMLREYG